MDNYITALWILGIGEVAMFVWLMIIAREQRFLKGAAGACIEAIQGIFALLRDVRDYAKSKQNHRPTPDNQGEDDRKEDSVREGSV